jgi:hypothetical protein
MPFSDRVQQLDREIAATLERVVSNLHRELAERLQSGSSEILRRFEEFRPELPAQFVSHDHMSPVAEEAAAAARRSALGDLRDALAAVDAARSQAEILHALLRESGRFASRAAVLLVRGGELRGWGAHGFAADEGAVRGVSVNAAPDSAWGRFAEGQGALRLAAADSADLCGRLDSALPLEAVVVPLVLRDRLAAGLYADVLDREGGELQVEALQSLAYAAAQAIELLPLRERASTATLHLLDDTRHQPAEPAAAPEPPPAAPASDATDEADGAGEQQSADAAQLDDTAVQEPLPEAETAPAEAAPETAEESPAEASDAAPAEAEESWTVEAIEDEPAPALQAEPASPEVSTPSPAVEEETSFARTAELVMPTPRPAVSGFGGGGGDTVLMPRPGLEPREPIPSPYEAAPVAAPVEADATPAAPLRPVPAAGFAPASAPDTPGVPGSPGSDDEPRAAGTSEVRPPSGIQGPGWAFATTRVPVSADDEALHEEARRLARLLVSEIKLYNEEQVDEGRRNRDVYERLKDDIDRSRQMYEERVEPRVLASTDYFYQELVRILAAGDPKALGI